jgi:hypothetical protein
MKTKYECLYPDAFSEATITWTKPILISNFINLSYDKQWYGFFYKILVKYKTGHFKLVYIGKTFKQFASSRLLNPDHLYKQNLIKEKFPHHNIYVSLGNLTTNKKRTAGLIDSIERLLIYSHANDDFKMENSKNTYHHNLTYGLKIWNKGYKTGMYNEVSIGVYYKE